MIEPCRAMGLVANSIARPFVRPSPSQKPIDVLSFVEPWSRTSQAIFLAGLITDVVQPARTSTGRHPTNELLASMRASLSIGRELSPANSPYLRGGHPTTPGRKAHLMADWPRNSGG